mmetsp:Transcript_98521/g.275909  ORF Transcript_98521/g.275909 Transcript_98521/m.275909 type:complete len:311 (-) Transcript_98521:627-1559(-)
MPNNAQNSFRSNCPSQFLSPFLHRPPTSSRLTQGSNSAKNCEKATGDRVATSEPARFRKMSFAPPRNILDNRICKETSLRSISSGVTTTDSSPGKGGSAGSHSLWRGDAKNDFALPTDFSNEPIIRLQAPTAFVVPPCGVRAGSGAVSYFAANIAVAFPAVLSACNWNSALAFTSSNLCRKARSAASRFCLARARLSRNSWEILSDLFPADLRADLLVDPIRVSPESAVRMRTESSSLADCSSRIRSCSSAISSVLSLAASLIISWVNGGTMSRGCSAKHFTRASRLARCRSSTIGSPESASGLSTKMNL